mmetsp:Transcript_48622/g.127053  ORF Transcript_48622/g.127053 Transcript_48622/m.127053 type:complete len:234 (-) Transcript_48622:123-824(-)
MRKRHASSAGRPFWKKSSTRRTASSLLMNSHTPSVARMRNRSSAEITCEKTSGVGMSPQRRAWRSPRAREMQSPGPSSVLPLRSYMRAGTNSPSPSPSSGSTAGRTQPPLDSMRAFSPGRSTLWSVERARAWREAPSSAGMVPRTQRQSPTPATKSSAPCTKATTAHVPESSGLTIISGSHAIMRRWMLHASNASASVPIGSSMSSWSATSSEWYIVCIASFDTSCPYLPCPS